MSAFGPDNSTSNWLAGLRLDAYNGTTGQQVAEAAHAIDADILSPAGVSHLSKSVDPNIDGFLYFTTEDMIVKAHELGLQVKPWTVSSDKFCDECSSHATDQPHEYRSAVPELGCGWSHHRLSLCCQKALKAAGA